MTQSDWMVEKKERWI